MISAQRNEGICPNVFVNQMPQFSILDCISQILRGWFLHKGLERWMKCKKTAAAADCLQGAEGQTAPGVANEKLTMRRMVIGNALP